MGQCYTLNKNHILKWREKNIDKWRELNKIQARRFYTWKKIKTEFFNILIDEVYM